MDGLHCTVTLDSSYARDDDPEFNVVDYPAFFGERLFFMVSKVLFADWCCNCSSRCSITYYCHHCWRILLRGLDGVSCYQIIIPCFRTIHTHTLTMSPSVIFFHSMSYAMPYHHYYSMCHHTTIFSRQSPIKLTANVHAIPPYHHTINPRTEETLYVP